MEKCPLQMSLNARWVDRIIKIDDQTFVDKVNFVSG